jgi:hypothetical protein
MKYREISKEELARILKEHAEWLDDSSKGARADLSWANLSWANLRSANLSWADLRSANLRWADLRWADLDKRYIQISRIGSRKDMTTYCFEDDIIWCGCWKGSLKEFEERVKETHKDNKQYLKEYLGFIKYLRSLK